MKQTRCKFICESVEDFGNCKKVKMHAVCDDANPENVSFSKWTPNGDLSFMVTNPDVFDSYKPKQAYYLDIIPIESEAT